MQCAIHYDTELITWCVQASRQVHVQCIMNLHICVLAPSVGTLVLSLFFAFDMHDAGFHFGNGFRHPLELIRYPLNFLVIPQVKLVSHPLFDENIINFCHPLSDSINETL